MNITIEKIENGFVTSEINIKHYFSKSEDLINFLESRLGAKGASTVDTSNI